MKKLISLFLVTSILTTLICGCGTKNKDTSDSEKVTLTVGNWPTKQSKSYERMQKTLEDFKIKYPNIDVVTDEWVFSADTFLPKAAANQLPTFFYVPFTEIDKMINSGYAADITKYMDEYEYTKNINDDIKNVISKDGKIYFVPYDVYCLGLLANKDLFKQAGIVDKDGYVKYPQTFEELGQTAALIKEKTGSAGFIMPTMGNVGGWHFMSIAWAYGTKFMDNIDGKWKATFSSPECEAALQFVKDLKWKYNAVSDNTFIDAAEMEKMFCSDQGAMFFNSADVSTLSDLSTRYGLKKDSLSIGTIPAGPQGKFSLMGGSIYCMSAKATEQEIDAAFKWIEFIGRTPNITEDGKQRLEETYKENYDKNCIVGVKSFNVWKDGGKAKFENEMRKKYLNVDLKDYQEYTDFKNVTVKYEEPVCCQELYATLDGCIQAVLSDKNSNVHDILKKAADDFQLNYLDFAN